MQHTTHFLNHAELPLTAAAYNTKRAQLLLCDGRYLRLYSSQLGYQCIKSMQLPPTVRARTPSNAAAPCALTRRRRERAYGTWPRRARAGAPPAPAGARGGRRVLSAYMGGTHPRRSANSLVQRAGVN